MNSSSGNVYWQGELAGLIGYSGNNLVLHALAEKYRSKGLSKYWWSAVCAELFASGAMKWKARFLRLTSPC